MAFRGSELHNSGGQGRLEYSEELEQAGNESDQGTNNNKKKNPIVVTFPSSSRVHDASDNMEDKKKALLSSPSSASVHEASELPSDESDNMKNKKALVFFPSPASVHDASELPSDESDNMKDKKKALVSLPSPARVRDWSELPRDISYLIGDKMKFFPHLQKFGAASKEWRGIACEIIKTLPAKIKSEPPMLLLPYNEETQTTTFLEIGNSKKYDVNMPELKDRWICGASNNWLAMVDRNLNLSLFNTVTRARIKLPHLPPSVIEWFHEKYDAANISDRENLIWKLYLSNDPSSSDCLIAIIIYTIRALGVCRLGDEGWTMEVTSRKKNYVDISFYQGNFFAIKECLYIHVYEYHKQGDLKMLKHIKQPVFDLEFPPLKKKLMESCGDLFHIRSVGMPDEPLGFEIYRFDPTCDEDLPWSRVYSLGDQSLFLGLNDSICMSVKEFSWCKSNCIYFVNDRNSFFYYGYEWDNGVYSLEENRVIARFDIQHPIPTWPYESIWYQPNV